MDSMQNDCDARFRSLTILSQRKLVALLSSITSADLYIHSKLIKPFERVCGASWLRQHGINKIFKIDPKAKIDSNSNKVYLIPSNLIELKHVLDQINSIVNHNQLEYISILIIIVPKVLSIYENLIEEEGLSGIVTVKSYQWEFMYLDESLISLELPMLFKSFFIDKDLSLLNCISNSLWTLFQIIGCPPIMLSFGKHSTYILEMYDIFKYSYKDCNLKNDCEFNSLLIIDRDQDFASTLLTPITYSGLLYEIFNVICNDLELDPINNKYKQGKLDLELNQEEIINKKPIKMSLDSTVDLIYSEIKYLHFSNVFSILSTKAKDLNVEGDKISQVQLNEMKQVISTKLQQVIATKKCLYNHILACETIISILGNKFEDMQLAERCMLHNRNRKSNLNYIEENICTETNKYLSLKLICLFSLTQGFTSEEYNSLIIKYLHAFGYKYLYVFNNLITSGILTPPSNTKFPLSITNISSISEKLPKWNNNFQNIANKLKQFPSESDNIATKDLICPSFVFNGSYIPLIATISKILLTTENINDFMLKMSMFNDIKISGPIIDSMHQSFDEIGKKLDNIQSNKIVDINVACQDLKLVLNLLKSEELKKKFFSLKSRSLLIYIVGGVTQAEIAACRLIERLLGGKIVIASDSIVTSETLLQSAM